MSSAKAIRRQKRGSAHETIDTMVAELEKMSRGLDTRSYVCDSCGQSSYHNFKEYQSRQLINGVITRLRRVQANIEKGE